MAINVSVQYNGGLLPDIILLTLCDYINPFNTMKSFCPYSQCSHPNLLTCVVGIDAFMFFFKYLMISSAKMLSPSFCQLVVIPICNLYIIPSYGCITSLHAHQLLPRWETFEKEDSKIASTGILWLEG